MRANDGAWIGWPGSADDDELEPFEDDGLSLVPVALTRPGGRGVLRGLLQRHPLAALPRRRRQAGVPPRVVGLLRRGQPALRRRGRPRWRPRARPSGCRTTSSSWCRRCCASSGPTCGSASTSTSRSRPAELFSQLPWRRQILEGLLGADLVGFQLSGAAANFVRLVRQRVGHKTHRDTVYLPDGRPVKATAFPISIDTAGFEELARSEGGRGARRRDPRGARQPAKDLPRRRPARLHQGHLRPAARVRRADRRRAPRRRGRRLRPGRDARRGSGSSSTASCATTSTGWSAASTATSAGSAARRSPTSTPPTPARRWPRSTGPPTSWWSRRSATA